METFLSNFKIGQLVYWNGKSSWGVVETKVANGIDEQGNQYPDSIGIRCPWGYFTIQPSHLVFASIGESIKHVSDAHKRCDDRNELIQSQYA